jgi:hypothetical protein
MKGRQIMNKICEIESEFTYRGFNCVVAKIGYDDGNQWRVGYVELTEDCDCLEIESMYELDTLPIDCHGGITFYGTREYYKLSKPCIGFDCAHYGDTLENCSEEFCVTECQHIADQLILLYYKPKKDKKLYKEKKEAIEFLESQLFADNKLVPGTIAEKWNIYLKLAIEALKKEVKHYE